MYVKTLTVNPPLKMNFTDAAITISLDTITAAQVPSLTLSRLISDSYNKSEINSLFSNYLTFGSETLIAPIKSSFIEPTSKTVKLLSVNSPFEYVL